MRNTILVLVFIACLASLASAWIPPNHGKCYYWKKCSKWRPCGWPKYCDYRFGSYGYCCSRYSGHGYDYDGGYGYDGYGDYY